MSADSARNGARILRLETRMVSLPSTIGNLMQLPSGLSHLVGRQAIQGSGSTPTETLKPNIAFILRAGVLISDTLWTGSARCEPAMKSATLMQSCCSALHYFKPSAAEWERPDFATSPTIWT